MTILRDPREEAYAQELAKPDMRTLEERYVAAGYKGGNGNSSRMARKANIQARVKELRAIAAELAEIDTAWMLIKLKRLCEFNLDDYLTAANEDGDRFVSLRKCTRDDLERLAELTVETYVEGRGELAQTVKRTKLKSHDRIAAIGLMAKIKGVGVADDQPPAKVELTVSWKQPAAAAAAE